MPDGTVDQPDSDRDDSSPSAMEGALDRFKADARPTDEDSVNDASGAQARMMWNPVTDAGGSPPDAPAAPEESVASGFHFDLGGALARLSGDAPPAETPTAAAPAPPVEQAAPAPAPTPPVAPAPAAAPAPAPAPTPTPAPTPAPPAAPAPAPAPAPTPEPSPTAHLPVAEPLAPAMPPATPSHHAPATQPAEQSGPAESPAAPTVSGHRPAPTAPADLFADDPPANYPRRIPGSHLSELHVDPNKARDPQRTPPVEQAAPAATPPSVFEDVAASAAPTLPPTSPELGAPTLPAANPAAPPSVVDPVATAPSTPDITALRSAQMRQSRQQRKGKLFGRIVLAFIVVGGLLAAALLFGRSLLFQNDWDAALTPLVNEVQATRGAEFDHAVPLVTLDAEQFGARLRAATIGDGWAERIPEWRALGLTTGTVTEESVTAALVEARQALYDPTSDTIYRLEGSLAEAELRVALEAAFDEQLTGERQGVPAPADQIKFTGVSSADSIAARAVEAFASGPATERQPANEALPVPISYELAAIEVLGEPILVAAGVDPATFTLGSALPDDLGAVLDDGATNTPSALLQPGERSLGEPAALGTDDWSLVWGARLPQTSVDRLVGIVTGDSYRPVDRNGTVCFLSVFQTGSEADGSTLFAEMLAWAAAAPAESQSVASQLGPQRVQLEACDPGADFGIAPNTGTVDALIDRQSLRLTN